jgi:hypothetical protein
MERLKHLIELATGENGIFAFLSFIPLSLFTISKRAEEPEFLGDNAPYTITDLLRG